MGACASFDVVPLSPPSTTLPHRITASESDRDWLCAICSEKLTDPVITFDGACTHHFCSACLAKWTKRVRATCPICCAHHSHVLRDKEFEASIGVRSYAMASAATAPACRQSDANALALDVLWPPGIAVASDPATGRVTVIGVVPGNGASQAGIRTGAVVLGVNGVAVHDHQIALQLIEQHAALGALQLIVEPTEETTRRGDSLRASRSVRDDVAHPPLRTLPSGVLREEPLQPREAVSRRHEQPFFRPPRYTNRRAIVPMRV